MYAIRFQTSFHLLLCQVCWTDNRLIFQVKNTKLSSLTVNKLIIQFGEEGPGWVFFLLFPTSYLVFFKMSPKSNRSITKGLHQRASCQAPSQLCCVSLCKRNLGISVFKLATQVILTHTQRISNALPVPLPHWTVHLPPWRSIHCIFREWGKWGMWYPYVCGSSWGFSDMVKYRVISKVSWKHCSESFQQCLRRIIIE